MYNKDMLFENPQETLFIVLAISVAILTIFLAVVLIYLILVLRDASKILDKTRDVVEKVNNFVVKPVKLASNIFEHIRPMIERLVEQASSRVGTTRRKRK
jgi:uncharacterized protein YoxC